jgi:hypothetical protein
MARSARTPVEHSDAALGDAGRLRAVILYTLIIHALVGESGSVVTTSAEAYCPFGGIETLYTLISSGGTYVSHTEGWQRFVRNL